MNNIRLLDCTLRDGGHINQGNFGEKTIKNVIKNLIDANTDIIEVGFLWDCENTTDVARYYTIADVKRILPEDKKNSKFSLMADFIDLEHLEPYDGTIEYIRLSFKRHRLDWGLKTGKILMDKGYKVFINLTNNNVYTDKQYIEAIEKVNELHPYGFSIVDTFGTMRIDELTHRYYLVENNLASDIVIGLHLHENLGLAYSLAQHFTQIISPKREVVIDGSLLGMGRVPGNLCIDQMMDYMNNQYGEKYDLGPVFDAIDDYIAPIKKQTPWGYDIPYALSAKYDLHRTYAEFLIGKWKLKTSDIERILSGVDKSEAENFNRDYIQKEYEKYLSIEINDLETIERLKNDLNNKNLLVLAPGSSINNYSKEINEYIDSKHPIVIGVHCIPENIPVNYVFFTNIKRFDLLYDNKTKLITTSNITRYNRSLEDAYILNYSNLAYTNDVYCEDSVVMLLNLLVKLGIENIAIAGFDGFERNKNNFYIEKFSRNVNDDNFCIEIKKILKDNFNKMKIDFITPSFYEDYNK